MSIGSEQGERSKEIWRVLRLAALIMLAALIALRLIKWVPWLWIPIAAIVVWFLLGMPGMQGQGLGSSDGGGE